MLAVQNQEHAAEHDRHGGDLLRGVAAVSASEAQKCTSSPERAVAAIERSQAPCMRASAPVARTVSMPERDSTSTPWRAEDSACSRFIALSSGRWSTRPTTIMSGSMSDGIKASGPTMMKRTARKMTAKSEIGDRDHGARSEELADRVEVAQLVGENADRRRPLRHLQRHDMLEDVGGEHDVDLLAGHVDDPAADHAEQEIEDDREAQAEASAIRDGIAPFGITRSYTFMMKIGDASAIRFTTSAAIATWL